MAWKQDLAKLKQQLDPGTEVPAPKARPKAPPRPEGPKNLEDEDAVFLSAMGLKPSSAPPPPPAAAPALPAPAPSRETFEEALQDLKGVKPLARGPGDLPPRAAPPGRPAPKTVAPTPPPPDLVPPQVQAPAPPPVLDAAPVGPARFQLAAGMAIEVDGSLDLRGHALSDALDRLKDRLEDGVVLGWRSLQVILGSDPVLHEGLLDLLASGQTPMVTRYAQAPIPMGGTQAWLLYLGSAPAQP